jgi:hypothetical protein
MGQGKDQEDIVIDTQQSYSHEEQQIAKPKKKQPQKKNNTPSQ